MAFLLANGCKRRYLSVAFSCHLTLQAKLAREHHCPLLSLFVQLQQCQLYSRPRGPLWRGRKGIGKEALHVLGEVKRTKFDNIQLGNTFRSKVARLLKTDLLAVLQELQRQNEVDLALMVFNLVRQENWYKPDLYVYKDMLHSLARAKRVHDCERLMKDFKLEGLPPDGLLLTEVMTAYLECGMLPQAMETFDGMRKGSVPPDLPAFKILLKYLKKLGNRELRKKLRSECLEFYEGIVESKHRRREESDEDELEMNLRQLTNAEDSDDVLRMERHQKSKQKESEKMEEEMVQHQRSKLTGSDEEEWEMEYKESDEEEVEIERHQIGKHEDSDEKEEEKVRHQRSNLTESEEEDWELEYKEDDVEEVEIKKYQRAKHGESEEKEGEKVRHQRSKLAESEEGEWDSEEYEENEEEKVETVRRHRSNLNESEEEDWELEDDVEEGEIKKYQRAKHGESDEKEGEKVRHQRSKLTESDEGEWESEYEENEEEKVETLRH